MGRRWKTEGWGLGLREFGSERERLHGKLDDADGRDIEYLQYVKVLQPLCEIVGFVLDTWSKCHQ